MTFVVIADSNISHLKDYFNHNLVNDDADIKIIAMSGRDINATALKQYQPKALLVRSVTKVDATLLADNTSVEFIGSATIGTDHIDLGYLAKRSITFSNAAGCSKASVAQYVLTAILTADLNSNQPINNSDIDKVAQKIAHKARTQPSEFTLGIIGLGNIGTTLANYADDMGWKVLGYDPLLDKVSSENDNDAYNHRDNNRYNNSRLSELLMQADAVSLHVPLTTLGHSLYPTKHLIDEAELAFMKTDCMLINSSRGAVIKESALIDDIKRNNRVVALDVFEHEPVVSKELLNLLTIATPHIAGYTLEGKLRGTDMVYQAFCEHFSLPIDPSKKQSMQALLPSNDCQWHKLQQDWSLLTNYYDIAADDTQLKALPCQADGNISITDFDNLRKNYTLRREWL